MEIRGPYLQFLMPQGKMGTGRYLGRIVHLSAGYEYFSENLDQALNKIP